MKKLLVLMMGIGLIIVISACGNKENKAAAPKATDAAAATGKPVTIQASNFKFDQAEYRVKKGEPVTITLENTQGVHGARINEFKVTVDNNNKTVTFTPDKTGSFPIICSIMCGSGHASMKSTLIVE